MNDSDGQDYNAECASLRRQFEITPEGRDQASASGQKADEAEFRGANRSGTNLLRF
jgi:hypothetical protein